MKEILYMSSENAKKYFLKGSSYFNMELPKYFNFDELLKKVNENLGEKNLSDYNIVGKKVENYDNVNYKFNHNKDGKYAWRQFQLIHPALYVNLINIITEDENWKMIKNRFKSFKKNGNIICCSYLIESSSKEKDKGANINNWWNKVEQQSIRLALDYDYIGITDVTDCYGSIYTHSISWALHGIEEAKKSKGKNNLLGDKIDKELRNMSYAQTNGIPQGSTLMDFIAELVLGYCDLKISERLEKEDFIKDYKIIRYRDDYRVFSLKIEDVNKIIKVISQELAVLNMRLNTQKTLISEDIILNSIKRDKLPSLEVNYNNDISIQKNILYIRKFSKEYPNSTRVSVLLNELYKKSIENIKRKPKDNTELISIIVDIMFNNTISYHICVAILSKLLNFENKSNKELIIKKIEEKFSKLPNTDYLSIWLQRITISYNRSRNYDSLICQKIYNSDVKIWNSDWTSFKIEENLIVKNNIIENINDIVPSEDLKIFDEY